MIAPAVPVAVAQDSGDNSAGFCPWRHGSYDYNYMLLNDKKVPIDVMRHWVFARVLYVVGNGTSLEDWGKVLVKLDEKTFDTITGAPPSEYVVEACILDEETRSFHNCTVVLDATAPGEYIVDLKDYMNETGWSNIYLVATAKNTDGTAVLHDAVHLLFYWDYMTPDWEKYVDVTFDITSIPTIGEDFYYTVKITSADTNAYELLSDALTDLRRVKVTLIDENGVEWPVNYIVIPTADNNFLVLIRFYVGNGNTLSTRIHLRFYLLKYPVADWLSYTYTVSAATYPGTSYNKIVLDGWAILAGGKATAPASGSGYYTYPVPSDDGVSGKYTRVYILALEGTSSGDAANLAYYYSYSWNYVFKWGSDTNNYPALRKSDNTWFTMAPSFSASRSGMTHIFFVDYDADIVTWIYKYFDAGTSIDTYDIGATLYETGYDLSWIIWRYYGNGAWLSNPIVYYARIVSVPGYEAGLATVSNVVIPSDDLSY